MSKRINQSGQIIVADRFVSLSDPDSKNYFRVTSSISSSDKLQESIVNDFLARYDLQIDGSTNISYGTTLTAKVYDRYNQEYVDFPSIEFSWKDVNGKVLKNAHNILYIPADYKVEESTEKKVVCTWNHIVDYSIGTTLKNVEVEINISAQLSVLDIVEYQWNDCLTEQELEEQGFKQLEWYTSVPSNENNNLYLWSRRSTNNRVSWNYYRTTGQKGEDGQTAKDIKIISTRYYFDRAEKNSSGGKGDYVANQIAVLSLRYFGIGDTEQVEWYFNGDLRYPLQIDRTINLDYTSLENKDTLDISVKYNGEIYDTIQIKTNVIKSTYAGILPSSDISPIEINGREVIDGDHFIYINSNGEPIVRLFTNGEWKDITGDDSAYYSQVMSNVLYDVMKQQEVISTENGTYNFFRQLASFSAFIENLFVKNLNINNNKFNVCIGFDGNKNLTFDITWDGISIFKIDPNTGNVFIGKPNSDLTDAEYGFMYDALSKQIRSKNDNVIIYDDGRIYGNFVSVLQYMPYTFDDSLDSSHPFECDFFIPSSATIKSIKISVKGNKYRSYSKSAIANSEPWAKTGDIVFNLDKTTVDITLTKNSFIYTESSGSHYHKYEKLNSISVNSGGSHSHQASTDTFGNISIGTYGSDHTHSLQVSSTTDNTELKGDHTHKLPEIITDVKGTITNGNINHTHTLNYSHSHSIDFGIYEATLPSNVNLYFDNGNGYSDSYISLGSNEILASDLDITNYFYGNGWKRIKFTSSSLGRISVQLIAELLVTTS